MTATQVFHLQLVVAITSPSLTTIATTKQHFQMQLPGSDVPRKLQKPITPKASGHKNGSTTTQASKSMQTHAQAPQAVGSLQATESLAEFGT